MAAICLYRAVRRIARRVGARRRRRGRAASGLEQREHAGGGRRARLPDPLRAIRDRARQRGGAGRFRGANAQVREFRYLGPRHHAPDALRQARASGPTGSSAGRPGRRRRRSWTRGRPANASCRRSGRRNCAPARRCATCSRVAVAGAIRSIAIRRLSVPTSWPRSCSAAAAHRDYGVVIAPDGSVDPAGHVGPPRIATDEEGARPMTPALSAAPQSARPDARRRGAVRGCLAAAGLGRRAVPRAPAPQHLQQRRPTLPLVDGAVRRRGLRRRDAGLPWSVRQRRHVGSVHVRADRWVRHARVGRHPAMVRRPGGDVRRLVPGLHADDAGDAPQRAPEGARADRVAAGQLGPHARVGRDPVERRHLLPDDDRPEHADRSRWRSSGRMRCSDTCRWSRPSRTSWAIRWTSSAASSSTTATTSGGRATRSASGTERWTCRPTS